MTDFLPPPTNAVDWLNLGINFIEVNGHVESTFSKAKGCWSPLRFVADPYLRLHGMAPGLNYGQQALEGLKAFRGPGDTELTVFRPDSNALRMQHSADVVSMPQIPVDMFVQACLSAVAHNASFIPPHDSGGAAYLRPLLFGSSPHLMMSAPEDYKFCVYIVPVSGSRSTSPAKAIIAEGFDRTAPNGTGHAKLGGNYAPVLKWAEKAKNDGYSIILHLDSAKHEEIDEFSTSGFIGVKRSGPDEITLVVPDSRCIIESVTSDSIIRIAQSFGWTTEKRPINYRELPDFVEVLAAGTFLGLVPIRSITRHNYPPKLSNDIESSTHFSLETITYISESKNDGGPVFQRLFARLRALQRGTASDDFGWRFTVTAEDQIACPVRE
ncbi:branched-chain amino acid aminotransferase [Seiridium cupressi]